MAVVFLFFFVCISRSLVAFWRFWGFYACWQALHWVGVSVVVLVFSDSNEIGLAPIIYRKQLRFFCDTFFSNWYLKTVLQELDHASPPLPHSKICDGLIASHCRRKGDSIMSRTRLIEHFVVKAFVSGPDIE